MNFRSEHEFQHPEGVSTSLALHPEGLVGGFVGRMILGLLLFSTDNPLTSPVVRTLLAFVDIRRGVATVISSVETSSWAVAMATRRTTIQMYFDIFLKIEYLIMIFSKQAKNLYNTFL